MTGVVEGLELLLACIGLATIYGFYLVFRGSR